MDEVLATLKDDYLKVRNHAHLTASLILVSIFQEKEKHREINALLGAIEDDRFAKLVALGRKITDYGTDKQSSAGSNNNKIM